MLYSNHRRSVQFGSATNTNETPRSLVQSRFTASVSRALLATNPERRNSTLNIRNNLPTDDTMWASLLIAGEICSSSNNEHGSGIILAESSDSFLTLASSTTSSSSSSLKSSESVNDYIVCLIQMAEERIHLKKYYGALSCYEEVSRIQKHILKENQENDNIDMKVDWASTLSSTANVYIMVKDVLKAENYLIESLKILRNVHKRREITSSDDSIHDYEFLSGLAYTFKLLGRVYTHKRQYRKAKSACMEALRFYGTQCDKNLLGDVNKERAMLIKADMSAIYVDVGGIHVFEGNFIEAKGAFITALNALIKLKPRDRNLLSNTAKKLNSVGEKLLRNGLLDNALEAFLEALVTRRAILDKDDIDIASTLVKIGDTFERKGLLEASLNSYMQALEIASPQLGSNDKSIRNIVKKIGMIRSYVPGIVQYPGRA